MFYISLNHYSKINNKSNNNKGQSVSHLVSEGKKLARGNILKKRHDNVVKIVHWKLSEIYQLERKETGMNICQRRCGA